MDKIEHGSLTQPGYMGCYLGGCDGWKFRVTPSTRDCPPIPHL